MTSSPLAGSGCVRDDLSGRRVGLVLFAFLVLRRQAGRQNPVAWETHAGYTCRKGYERTWADRPIARSATNRFRHGLLSSPAMNSALFFVRRPWGVLTDLDVSRSSQSRLSCLHCKPYKDRPVSSLGGIFVCINLTSFVRTRFNVSRIVYREYKRRV